MFLKALRRIALAGFALGLAACAHRPTAPAVATHTIVPPAPVAAPQSNAAAAALGAAPQVAMPGEWHHQAAEDYDDLFDRMRAGFALQEVQEPAIDEQLQWFVHNPDYLERTFQRAQRYLYHIVTEVEARGMPMEFALLPVVESAYEPFAYSKSRAAGLWQFIPSTGRRFGLKQDWWYDGRRDVIESTRAALDYFQALHDQFGDWLLAIAAYNVGEATVQRAVDYNKAHGLPTDFWHLKLPAETRAYVPKLLALKRLMAEPERYGLEFAPIPNEPYFAVIDIGSQIDLKVAAKLAGTSYDELVELNPGFNRWATDPDGPNRLLVPIDAADAFEAGLKTLTPEDRMHYLVHEVGPHETLQRLAKQYDTSVAVIEKLNGLKVAAAAPGRDAEDPAGERATCRSGSWSPRRASTGPNISTAGMPAAASCIAYAAARPWALIARRHRIPVKTLARLNHLGPSDTIIAGQRIVIERVAERRYRGETAHRSRRVLYRVRRGDTVYGIARQFQVSVKQVKNWNGLNQHHKIRPGQRLVLYIDHNGQEG